MKHNLKTIKQKFREYYNDLAITSPIHPLWMEIKYMEEELQEIRDSMTSCDNRDLRYFLSIINFIDAVLGESRE